MTRRRAFFLAILVYLALDLSLPAMPGAFVFEAADSVESTGGGRLAARVVVLPTPAEPSALPAAPLLVDPPRRVPVSPGVVPSGCRLARSLPRAPGDPAQPSEDPH